MKIKRSPKLKVSVAQHHIDKAVRHNSHYCMIAEAIKDLYPNLSHVSADLQSIRATDRKKALRYIYLTPQIAQLAIIMFDRGELFRPINFTLRGAHTVAAMITNRQRGKPTLKRVKLGRRRIIKTADRRDKPDVVGGRALPRHAGSKGIREFGVRAFTKEEVEAVKGEVSS